MRLRSAALFVFFVALAATVPAHAATVATVLIDVDSSAATGCGLDGTTAAGFERALVTTVEAGVVTAVQRRDCAAGAFGAPVSIGGPWPAPHGSELTHVESRIPFADLSGYEPGRAMRLVFLFTNASGTTAFTTLPDGSPIEYPRSKGGRRRSARPADGTQHIVIDGDISDWSRVEPLFDRGLHLVWMTGDSATLFFRFDMRDSTEPPVAANDSYAVRQGKPLVVDAPGVLGNDSDPEGSTLSATLTAPAAHGSVTLAPDGSFVYLNDGTLAGDGFDYKASDGAADSNTARVTINVTPNATPAAQNDAYSTSRGGTLNVPSPGVLANDHDADGDPLTAQVEANPARGTLTLLPDGSFTYIHDGSTEPSDTFTYTVSDGLARSAPASVTIGLSTSNAPPVAVDDVFHVANGGTLDVTAPGLFSNDLDSDTPQSQWTTTVIAGPSHGALTLGTGGAFTYVHDGSGVNDSFTYRISDGTSPSNVATVTIVAGSVNAPPVADTDNYTTPEDTPLVVALPGLLANDSDAEGATLSVSLVSDVTGGTLALQNNGSFIFTPPADAHGTYTFVYRASDGALQSPPVTVTITVTSVNDQPVTANDAYTIAEGGTLAIAAPGLLANDSDVDGPALTAAMTLAPLFGDLTVDPNGAFTYTHDDSESFNDTFTYTASDGSLTRTGTATITITEVNDAPVAVADATTTNEDTPLTIAIADLLANDSAGPGETLQTLTFVTASHAQHGTVSVVAGNVIFTPDANYFGTASFRYTITDNGTTSGAADPKSEFTTVTINVAQVNDAPAFTSTAIESAVEDLPYTYAIAASDVDTADPLAITGSGIPAWLTLVDHGNGTATLSGTPANAHVGSYPITLNLFDGTVTVPQTFTIVVANANDAPVATGDAASIAEDAVPNTATGNVLTNDSDIDVADLLTVTPLAASGTYGTIAIAVDGTFTYTLDNARAAVQALANGAPATDTFNYTVLDSAAATATAALTITIQGANDAPQFTSSEVTAATEDALYTYTIATSDADTGATLTLTSSALPSWLTLTGNTLSGTPSNADVGTWPVTLTVSDSLANAAQTFSIVVSNTNDTPAATDDAATIAEDAVPNTVTGDVLANDSDVDATDTLSVTPLNATGTYGAIAIAANGGFTYTLDNSLAAVQALANNASATDTFNYTIGDGNGGTANATLTITITGANDVPVFTSTAITAAPEDALYSYAIATSDVDTGASLTLTASALPAWLTLSGNTLSGTPANGDVGNHAVTLTVSDGITSSDQTFTIAVSNTNDTPVAQNDTGAVTEDAATNTATGNVRTNDSDVDLGDTLTITPVNATGTYGTVTIAADGAFTYTLDNSLAVVQELAQGATATDTFNYTIGDGNGGTANATLTITITGANDAPVFTSTAITAAPEDSLYSYAVATSDVDTGASLTLTSSALPSWLTLTGSTLSGTPANGDVGSYPVTLTIDDGIAQNTQSFTIVVSNTNDTPVAQNDSGAITEDAAPNTATGNVLTNDSDEDTADSLSVTPINTTGTYGSITIDAAGAFTYTLDNASAAVQALANNASATDTFNYTIGDGNGGTANATLTITITGVNDAPVFTSSAITAAPEDSLYSYVVATSDADTGASLTLTSSALPAWLTLTGNTLSGTPANGDVNSYPVTLTIDDGIAQNTQSFTIVVSNTNDTPVAQNDSGAITEDAAPNTATGNVLTNDSDEDTADSLSVTPVNTTGTYGSVTIDAAGAFTYTLDNASAAVQALANNASATDTFNYTIGDGNGGTANATLTITVTGVNDAPVFTSSGITAAPEDSLYSYVVATSDADTGASLTLTSTALPSWLTLSGNTLSGTPANGDVNSYPVTLTIDDGIAQNTQSFTIVVSNTNDTPVAQNDSGAITEDAAPNTATGNVLTNDTDEDTADSLSVTPVNTTGTYGSITIDAAGAFTYTLDNASATVQALANNASATDTFNYTIGDGNGGTANATLTVTITGVNDAPVFTSSAITAAPEDSLYSYVVATSDADTGASLTLTSTTLPAWLTLTGNTLSGTPANGDVNSYPVTLTIDDGIAQNTQSFTIVVSNTNDTPVAQNDSGAITEDAAPNTATGNVLTNDSDEDTADSLSVTPVNTTGTYGSVTIDAAGAFTYTLDNASAAVQALANNATVTDTFNYTIGDGNGGTASATLTITVTGVNDAPTFTSTAITAVAEDALYSYGITTNDVDTGASLTLTSSALPAWLTLVGNTLSGTPANANVGSFPITLTIDDGIAQNTQSFTIVVSNTPDAPVANPDSANVTEDAATNTASGNVLTNDVEVDAGDSLTVAPAAANGTYGSVTIAANGAYTYTLDNARAAVQALRDGHTVTDVFNYTATDTTALSSSSALTATVTGANDLPIAAADSYNLPLAGTLNATSVLANDSDVDTVPSPQTLTAAVVADNTAQGDLTFNADGTFTYVKTCGGSCAQNSDSFTYRVSDGIANSATVLVTISYNTPPVADADTVTGTEDVALTINASDLLNGDSDAQGIGTVSKIFVMTTPSAGTLSGLAGDNSIAASGGSMTFTPNADFAGSTTFTYQLEDNGGLRSTSATVTITLSSVNDAPFFTPGSLIINVNEDSGLYNTAWATNLRPGPVTATNESAQTLTFLVNPAVVKHDVNNPAANAISCTGSVASGTLFCTSSEEIGNTAVNRVGTTSNANLTFRTWPNAYGSVTFTAQLQDNGGIANGVNVYPTTPVSVTVNVAPINDPPSFSLSQSSITQKEDEGLIVLGGHPGSPTSFANTFSPGPNESTQTLVGYTVTADDPTLFAELSLDATTGVLRAKPAPNAFGSTTLRVSAKDNGGTGSGGVDTLTKNVPITYLAVNDRPSFQRGPDVAVAVNSGAYSQSWVASSSPGPANESAQVLTYTASNNNNPLFSQQPAISSSGVLTFTPAAGASGSATVTVGMTDNGGTANGGQNVAYGSTFVIVVGNINTPPRFDLSGNVEVQEDAPETIIPNFITNVSPGASASEAAQTVTFTISPQFTQFTSGPTLVPNGANYDLKFTVAPNYGGQIQTITVTAKDNGGVAGGGNDTSTKTFQFTQHHVNDAPLFNIPAAAPTVFSDSGPQTVTNFATSISAGPTEGCQSLTFIVTNNTNPSLFSAGPALGGASGCAFASGTLTYTTAPTKFGTATITVVLRDDNATPLNPDDDATSTAKSFTITVDQFTGNKNDAPTFTKGANQTILEDTAGTQTVAPWAMNITQGGDDSGQTVSFTVTNNNNAFFSTQPAVSSAGTLTYTLAANAHGVATVTVIAKDNGGTGGGGVDTSAPQQFTITVTPVNDAPTFTASNRSVAADAGPQTVANWISAFNPAAVGVTNESTQTVTFTISVVSTSNPDLFSAAPALTGTPARTLTFTAGAGQQGLATVSVTATDNGGTADGGANTRTQTFTISVGNVNDAPSFTKGGNQTVNEDSGARTVTNWASNVSTGPADESVQNLTFIIDSNSDLSLFAAGPTITRSGSFATLTFTPAANAFGTATIGVKVQDNGGTAFGGQDTSPVQTFDITINPINDRPSFDVPATAPTSLDTAGPITVNNFVTNITAGNAQESAQTLTFHIVTNSNTAMFTTQPAIAANGTLTYTAAHFGSADITINVKDNGGTASGGQDTSVNKTFKITVNAGDPPVVPNKVYQTHAGCELTIGAGDSPYRLLDGATGVTALTVTSIPTSFTGSTVTITNASTGTFKYDPAPGHVGTETFTFRVCDTRTPARCTDATATVTVTGTPIWFVDDSAPAGGNGTLARPFQSLSALEIGFQNDSSGTIFIFSGNYSAPTGFGVGYRRVLGQGSSGSFDTLTGIVVPPYGTIPARPTLGGVKPVIDGSLITGWSPWSAPPAGWHQIIRGVKLTSSTHFALQLNSGVNGVPADPTAKITVQEVEIVATAAGLGITHSTRNGSGGHAGTVLITNSSITVPRNATALFASGIGGGSFTVDNTPITTSATTSTHTDWRSLIYLFANSGGTITWNANSPITGTLVGAANGLEINNNNGDADFVFNCPITLTASGAAQAYTQALIWIQGLNGIGPGGDAKTEFNGRLNLTTSGGYPHAMLTSAVISGRTLAITASNNTINATNTHTPLVITGTYFDPVGQVKWQTINMNTGQTGFDIDTAAGPFTVSSGTIQNYSSGQCYRANDYLNPPSVHNINVNCIP